MLGDAPESVPIPSTSAVDPRKTGGRCEEGDSIFDPLASVIEVLAGIRILATQPRAPHAAGYAVVAARRASRGEVFAGAGHGGRMVRSPMACRQGITEFIAGIGQREMGIPLPCFCASSGKLGARPLALCTMTNLSVQGFVRALSSNRTAPRLRC